MAYYQQPCDSYFVESHGERRFREEMKERQMRAKLQQQHASAEGLSQLASREYREDVLQHMELMESKTLPDVAAIDVQSEIQWYMRPYLIDFLIEAHTAFGLLPETLFLTINLLDRYCSRRIVYKKHYQLVGCSALLIAAKYGDRKDRIPTIKELRNMCCGLYEDDMFTQMEWHVLETVDWLVGHPTIDSFLQMALENVAYDPALEHMACYISEIAMFQKEFVSTRPSDMARSSLALARCILNRPQALSSEWASQYESQTLIILSQHLHRPSSILSRKYASHHFSQVSIVLDEFLSRQASISRCYAPPLTPPTKTCSEGFEKLHPPKCTPVTPHKNRFMPVINSGCPTPPETPAGQQYLKAQNARMRPPYPPTPASMKRQSQNQQNGLPFSLPPISQIAPTF